MTRTEYGAYENHIKTVESPGETDAAVLEKAGQLLLAAKETDDDEEFFLAINYNQRVWTVIQAYLVEENPLPDQIKANLISLSIFVDKQSFLALAERAPAKLDVLININRQIAAGFRSIPPSEEDKSKKAPAVDEKQ